MNEQIKPEVMVPEEYAQVSGLLERAFGEPEHNWHGNGYPKSAEVQYPWADHYVTREGGRVVAHVGLYPMTLEVDGAGVPMGGIGDVATEPECQGRGHFRTLMTHVAGQMRERGIPLAVLWGITRRYRHFGYEPAGRRLSFALGGRARDHRPATSGLSRGYLPGRDDATVLAAFAREPLRLRRSDQRHLGKVAAGGEQHAWVAGDAAKGAYLLLNDRRVFECAGDTDTLLAMFTDLTDRYHFAGLTVLAPYRDSPLTRGLYAQAEHWRVEEIGTFAIVDLAGLLRAFGSQLAARAEAVGLPRGTRLALRNIDTGDEATLLLEGGAQVTDDGGADPIVLPAAPLTRLLLGTTPECHGRTPAERQALAALFPLQFHFSPSDSV